MRDDRWTTRPWQGDGAGAWEPARDRARGSELVGHLAELRAAVTQHVCERREAGASVERVLGEIDGLVQRAEPLQASADEVGVLLGQVRMWSLDAYFDEPELRNAPRFY